MKSVNWMWLGFIIFYGIYSVIRAILNPNLDGPFSAVFGGIIIALPAVFMLNYLHAPANTGRRIVAWRANMMAVILYCLGFIWLVFKAQASPEEKDGEIVRTIVVTLLISFSLPVILSSINLIHLKRNQPIKDQAIKGSDESL